MLRIEKKNNIEVISFTVNKINALITDEIMDEIIKVLDKLNSGVIIDLKGVDYIDSSGFRIFLSILKRAEINHIVLKFANPEPGVLKLLQTLHLHTVFQIYNDIDTCIRSFM